MKIQVKCLSSLSNENGCDYRKSTPLDISDGSTVANVISAAGIRRSDVKIVFVNGKIADTGKSLVDNDNVTFAPAVGGM